VYLKPDARWRLIRILRERAQGVLCTILKYSISDDLRRILCLFLKNFLMVLVFLLCPMFINANMYEYDAHSGSGLFTSSTSSMSRVPPSFYYEEKWARLTLLRRIFRLDVHYSITGPRRYSKPVLVPAYFKV
jgi:hypothetical protein